MVETAAKTALFEEWQLPNWSSFLPNLLFAPALWLVFAPINTAIGTISGLALSVLSISLRLAVAKRISVRSESLLIGKAEIPLKAIGRAEVIVPENQFAERGSRLDARAFLALKGGLPGLVKVQIIDESDPTPYLLISTRRPEELAKALTA